MIDLEAQAFVYYDSFKCPDHDCLEAMKKFVIDEARTRENTHINDVESWPQWIACVWSNAGWCAEKIRRLTSAGNHEIIWECEDGKSELRESMLSLTSYCEDTGTAAPSGAWVYLDKKTE
ncbi:ULP_PROTEASE domain-containing protein [Pycnococcus provasolii]